MIKQNTAKKRFHRYREWLQSADIGKTYSSFPLADGLTCYMQYLSKTGLCHALFFPHLGYELPHCFGIHRSFSMLVFEKSLYTQ